MNSEALYLEMRNAIKSIASVYNHKLVEKAPNHLKAEIQLIQLMPIRNGREIDAWKRAWRAIMREIRADATWQVPEDLP